MGAVLAGASDDEVKKLRTIAEQLGVGYQLRDDLLGVFGNETKTGKSVSSDITEGKRTYLIEQFEKVASLEQREAFFKTFHNLAATPREILEARELLVTSGAKVAVEAEIASLQDTITTTIASLGIDEAYKQVFHELVLQCLSREV